MLVAEHFPCISRVGECLVDDVGHTLGIQDGEYNVRPFGITRDNRVVVPSRREFCEFVGLAGHVYCNRRRGSVIGVLFISTQRFKFLSSLVLLVFAPSMSDGK